MSHKNVLLRIGFSVAFIFIWTAAIWGQASTSLKGTVTDPTGAAVPGVTVTLTNIGTSASRTAVTDDSGVYQFQQVASGTYSVRAELSGFKTAVHEKVELLVNTPATLDLRLEIGQVSDIISVTAQATAINTTDATLGNPFNEQQIKQLPLEARNVVGLLSLQPGVTFLGDTTDSRNGAVNGGKSDQANVTLDGIDVNDQQQGLAFTSVLRVTLDSVQEFRVTTANPNANQGRSSGAQVAMVTKSGTNTFHGSLYEYHRNTATSANEYFLKRSQLQQGQPNKPAKLNRHVFGGSVGGPIRKDRFFFFFNYEGRRDSSQASVVRTVPSLDMRNGIIRYRNRDGGLTTLTSEQVRDRIDPLHLGPNPAVLAVFRQYPAPNDTSVGDGINISGFRFAAPTTLKLNTYITKFDYNLTRDGRHTLFWRGQLQADRGNGVPQFPGRRPNLTTRDQSKGSAVGYTAMLRNNLVNDFRWGFTRQKLEFVGASTSAAVSFRSIDDLFALTRSSGRTIPVHHFTDDIAWTKGSHSFQFGTNFRFIRNDRFNFDNSFHRAVTNLSWLLGTGRDLEPSDLDTRFRIAYGDAMMALLGIVSFGEARYNYDKTGKVLPVGAPVLRRYGADEYEFYAQDSWRAKPNLTFTVGMRYSLFSPPFETRGLQVAPTFSLGDWIDMRGTNAALGIPSNTAPRVSFDLAGPKNNRRGFYDWNKNNFAPRFAFAYSPGFSDGWLRALFGGPGRSSIRGGYGIVYDRIGAGLATTYDQSGSFGLSTRLQNQSSSLRSSTAPRFTGLNELPPAVVKPAPPGGFPATPPNAFAITFGLDDRIKTPYSQLLNFSIARQLPGDITVEGAYVGRLGRKLLIQDDLAMPVNLFDPASGMDYFTAANLLVDLFERNTPVSAVPSIPYWENIFPGIANPSRGMTATQVAYLLFGRTYAPDYTSALFDIDVGCDPACSRFGPYAFFNNQYSALSAWRSRAISNYHAFQLLVRKRFSHGVWTDFNYTFSKSIDWASATERTGPFVGFTVNTWSPGLQKSVSDFDTQHSVNSNWGIELPFGRDKALLSNVHPIVDHIIGGWQLTGIFRWTSGLPVSVGNGRNWPTNWNITGNATRIGSKPETHTTRNAPAVAGAPGPNLFGDPRRATPAYTFTRPGQVGERTGLRGDGYFTIDAGLSKSWRLPWEGHKLQFRWEVFNVTNSVRFDVFSLTLDLGNIGSFGKYSGILTNPRVMQFALRYDF